MMGPAVGVPTALIWNEHFDRRFHVNACRPGAPYVALNTALHDAEAIASALLQTYRKTRKAEDRAAYEAWIATQENPGATKRFSRTISASWKIGRAHV